MDKTKKCYYEKEIAKFAAAMQTKFADKLNSIVLDGKLTVSHYIILNLLNDRKDSNMSELAKNLKLTMSATTSIIDKMVELKLVKRHHSEDDRRIVLITLTGNGKILVSKISKDRLVVIREILSVLSDKEKQLYLGLIKKIYSGLKDKI